MTIVEVTEPNGHAIGLVTEHHACAYVIMHIMLMVVVINVADVIVSHQRQESLLKMGI